MIHAKIRVAQKQTDFSKQDSLSHKFFESLFDFFFLDFIKKNSVGNLNFPFVRTRFVTTHNSVGFARKKAQTISFVERGFERLDLGHQAVSLFVVFIHG